ncbi:MAG: AI-2E family transporter [Planctomycetota bacterium]|jgi:predicted PurR-regulated permease PerM
MNLHTAVRLAVVFGVCWLVWLLRAVTAPLLGAYLLMLVFYPLHRRWRIRLGSSVSALACVAMLALLPPFLMLPALFDFQALLAKVPADDLGGLSQQIHDRFLEVRDGMPTWLQERLDPGQLDPENAVALAREQFSRAGQGLVAFFGGMFGIFSGLLLLPIFLYFLLDGGPWLARIRAELPADWHPKFDRILPKIEKILSLYLVSRTKVATVKGILAFGVLLLLGFPGSYSLGLALGGLSLLPVLGPLVGFFLLALVGFADGGITGGGFAGLITATVLYTALEVLEGYVLLPRMVGRGLGLSDFVVILTVLCGGALMGIFGLVIAVPMVAVGKILYAEFLRPVMQKRAEEGAGTDALQSGKA